jgi:RNA polymerase sigma-70 factor, ECF subfamily
MRGSPSWIVSVLDGLPSAARALLAEITGLEEKLDQRVEEGAAPWPTVTIPRETFARHLLEKLAEAANPADALQDLNAPDLYLACGCALGMRSAIAAFEASVMPRVQPTFVRLVRSSSVTVEDAAQEVLERILVAEPGEKPRIASYGGRAALSGWVQAAAVRVTLNLLRGKAKGAERGSAAGELESLPDAVADLELGYLKQHYRDVVRASLRVAVSQLDAEDRNLLRLYGTDGLSFERIGRMFGLNRSSVMRRLRVISARLLEGVREDLKAKLSLSSGEMESVFELVRSELEVSLSPVPSKSEA